METLRRQAPLAAIALVAAAAIWLGPIVQPQDYHAFADQSTLYQIPHFADVISNLGFAIVALAGALLLPRLSRDRSRSYGYPGYRLFIVALFFTAIGSSYYHLAPDNARLAWDRLPIALACGGLLAGVWGDARQKSSALFASWMAVLACYSVAFWYVPELLGEGDLRPYLMFQILPMLLTPLWQWVYRAPVSDRLSFGAALLLYAAAKAAEQYDHEVAAQLGMITGHTLKHLLATLAAAVIIIRLAVRQGAARRATATTTKVLNPNDSGHALKMEPSAQTTSRHHATSLL